MSKDSLRKFLFEDAAVRGEIVHLDAVWQEAISRHDYPPVIKSLLGEMLAAATLLTGTLKFEGILSMQIKQRKLGSGPVTLAVVECTSERFVRGLIRWDEELLNSLQADAGLSQLVGKGHMVVTLENTSNGERYQGIVDVTGDTLAHALEYYLQHSEQLDTRMWLASNENGVTGMLLQRLPEKKERDVDDWSRLTQLANTITADELLTLETETIVHRLFHQENVRLFKPVNVEFRCSCTRERVENTLRLLGVEEVNATIKEQGCLNIQCEFCNRQYEFDAIDVESLFSHGAVDGRSDMQH